MTKEKACSLIERYEKEYKTKYAVNEKERQRLSSLCELADLLAEEFFCEPIDILVSPPQTDGTIILYTDELVFEHGRSHRFFEQIKDADLLAFSKAKSGMLQVKFSVQNLWVAL